MRSLLVTGTVLFGIRAFAQPVIGGAGYSSPIPLAVAPGQVITLFVEASDSTLAPTLDAVSVTYKQGTDRPAAMLDVRPISSCLGIPQPDGSTCATILAVTAQLPFEMLTLCPLCGRPDIPASISVTVDGVTSAVYSVQPLNDQVHFLTACDIVMSSAAPRLNSALPCPAMVAHGDGTPVNAVNPATSSEELTAYAVGLGQTDPPLADGQPAGQCAPTLTNFAIDFNYRPNALASKPLGPSFIGPPTGYPMPLFSGSTPDRVGLYKVNFIVPPTPTGLPACAQAGTGVPYSNLVQTNLTVSIGSVFSFDGVGICVAPDATSQ